MDKQKHVKIVDTIGNFGAAERYIALSADFERFLKSTYGRVDLLKTDAEGIIKKYNLKGFVFGNYVTQEERYHFLFKISKQLEVLGKVAGSNNLGKGVLIIAFGAEGMPKANAHYNPSKQLINLNRGRKGNYKDVLKGENSFIHEYGHFLDFLQGRTDLTINKNFACESLSGGNSRTQQFSNLVSAIEQDEKYIKGLEEYSNANYLKSRVEIFARIFESAFTYYVTDKWKEQHAFFDVKKYASDWYLKKDVIKERGFGKDVVNILNGKAPMAKKKPVVKKEVTTASQKAKFPIVLEWTEGANVENVGYKTIEALEKDIKRFGFTDKPNDTYVKNKIWIKGYPHYIRIDSSKSKGDYNFETTKLIDFLNKYDNTNFDFTQYSKQTKKATIKKGQQSLFDKK